MAKKGSGKAASSRAGRGTAEAPPSPLHGTYRFLWTCTLYAGLVLAFSAVFFSSFVFEDPLAWLRTLVADSVAGTLSSVGMPVDSRGTVISGPTTSLMIVDECTGIDATILLVCAVLVFPSGWRARLMGVALSIGVMMVVNFVRVITLVYVGNYSPGWLEIAHLYVWPVFVIITGVSTLLIWAEKIAIPRP